MNLELSGRIALIAGASRGIGLAIARSLHAEGCTVALVARGRQALQIASKEFSGRVSIHIGDLEDAAATAALISEVAERWGRIDVAVCNAGSGASVPPGHETPEEWRRMLDRNLYSATNVIDAVRPVMAKNGGGSIVCISSICGMAALGAPVTYSAAKAALNATVRGLARPFAHQKIRINAVAPGNILFDGGGWARKISENPKAVNSMLEQDVAMARLGKPEEIADLVTFIASARANFVTGAIYVADGGQLRA